MTTDMMTDTGFKLDWDSGTWYGKTYRELIPESTRGAIERYVVNRIRTGGFLYAVLTNDLRGAMATADNDNLAALKVIVGFLHNEVPGICWGSADRVRLWLDPECGNKIKKESIQDAITTLHHRIEEVCVGNDTKKTGVDSDDLHDATDRLSDALTRNI